MFSQQAKRGVICCFREVRPRVLFCKRLCVWWRLDLSGFEWVSQLELVVEQDFNPVGAGDFEFDVKKDFDTGRIGFAVREFDRDGLAFDEDGDAVGFQ